MTFGLLRRTASWWLAGAVVLFSGCTTLTPLSSEPPSENIAQQWQQHRESVGAQNNWILEGRVAAHTADNGGNGKLRWEQREDRYQLAFMAPFGLAGVHLSGGPEQVKLHTSDGRTMTATDVEALLLEQVGWRLPLNSLHYWVRGVPAPASDVAPLLAFNDVGELVRLQQFQWQIEYSAYQKVGQLMMPHKIYMENGDLGVRLVIDRWRVGANNR